MRLSLILLSATASITRVVLGSDADLAYELFLPNFGCETKVDTTTCIPFSQYFREDLIKSPLDKFEVKCESCVTMDEYQAGQIIRTGLIDVIGVLVFPNATKMTLVTPGIIVQGKLIMEREQNIIVDSDPDITIELNGKEDIKWEPTNSNSESCLNPATEEMDCNIGKRAIVVAGGTVDIRAFPNSCKTWTHLADVVREDLPVPTTFSGVVKLPNVTGCTERVLIDEDFSAGSSFWRPSLGATSEIVTDEQVDGLNTSYYKISDRSSDWQGMFFDMAVPDNFIDCLIANVTYLLHIKGRLDTEDGYNSKCYTENIGCLSVKIHRLQADGTMAWKTLYTVPKTVGKGKDNEWFTIGVPIEFTDEDIDTTSVYSSFYLAGPESKVGISLSEISLELPDEKYYVDPLDQCQELIVNKRADLSDWFAYPFTYCGPPGTGSLTVESEMETLEDGSVVPNKYFSIRGRSFDFVSLESQLNPQCFTPYTVYKFSARVRLHSDTLHKVRFTMRTTNDLGKPGVDPQDVPLSTYNIENIGFCPPASKQTGWVECEANFMFTEEHNNAEKIQLIFVSEGEEKPNFSDMDYDDISVENIFAPVSTLILNTTEVGCWGEGAELMITSHTLQDKDTKVVKILKNEMIDNRTYITIDTAIPKHTTLSESPEFAVEVALLSREIVIRPQDNVEPLHPNHGGHMMFLHTADQVQYVEGVEFRNMGQQGLRGRYPLHFHICENVLGTVISKNTVRDSHQRCYVIHGTHNVTVTDNVAFDTFGHCYMVEDGFEQDNKFEFNIGARTKKMPSHMVLSTVESDQFASTFWISNPNNYFKGNVCAGGEDTGFWYEFLEFVRGPSSAYDPFYEINPSQFHFGAFEDNVCHSYEGDGFKLYPNGYFPKSHAAFQNTRSYKNKGDGVLLHNSAKLHIQGGTYADNRIQIEIDKEADDVWVSDARVIGYSALFQLEVEASNTKSHCPAHRANIGIQLHSFLRQRDSQGYNLTNIVFENFGESLTGCVGSSAMDVDPEVRDGHFDAYSIFQNLTFVGATKSADKISICELEKWGKIEDLVLQDQTGDLNPDGTNTPGSVVSRGGKMDLYKENCVEMEGSCALYCKNTCYRGINVGIGQASEYENWSIQAKTTDGLHKVEFKSYFDEMQLKDNSTGTLVKTPDHAMNFHYDRRRYFTATLPMGNFKLSFIDGNGDVGWPTIAEVMWEDPVNCGEYIDDANIEIVQPVPTNECDEMVKNGDAEDGENHWMHTGGDIKVVSGMNGGFAISSVHRKGQWQGQGQFLDSRCFSVGDTYNVEAKFRLWDEKTQTYVGCDTNEQRYIAPETCPRVNFRMRKLSGNRINDHVNTTFAFPIAETIEPVNANSWNTMVGRFTVTEQIASQNTIFLFFDRVVPGVNIIVDNVMVTATATGTTSKSTNRDFEEGNSRYWSHKGHVKLQMVSPGYQSSWALKVYERDQYWASPEQVISPDILEEGNDYDFSAMIKLLEKNTTMDFDCTPGVAWTGNNGTLEEFHACPVITLQTHAAEAEDSAWLTVATVKSLPDDLGWYKMSGVFTATKDMIDAPKLTFFFQKVLTEVDYIIDNIEIIEVEDPGCDNLVYNGGGEVSDKPMYWKRAGSGTPGSQSVVSVEKPGYNSTSSAIASSERLSPEAGLSQMLDKNCVQADGTVYEVKAMVKLTDAFKGSFECFSDQTFLNETKPRCPLIQIGSQNPGGAPQRRAIGSSVADWDKNGWNAMSGYFTFFANEKVADSLWVEFVQAQSDFIIVDEVSIKIVL